MLNLSPIILVTGKSVSPAFDTTMSMLECKSDNPIFAEMSQMYAELKPEIEQVIKPAGVFCEGKLLRGGYNDDLTEGRQVIYSMATLGQEVCEFIEKCMSDDPLKGLMASFMADTCLFVFEEQLKSEIKAYCVKKGVGIRKSYEPPNLLPIDVQKDIFEMLEADKNLGISLTSGLMLKPIKSDSHVYTISEDSTEFALDHDCSSCHMNNCQMRSCPISSF